MKYRLVPNLVNIITQQLKNNPVNRISKLTTLLKAIKEIIFNFLAEFHPKHNIYISVLTLTKS